MAAASVIEQEWVRVAKESDGAQVVALLRSEGLDAEFIAKEFVVCEAEQRIVGCVRARDLPEGGIEIASLAVDPSRRGRGLGRMLVTTALWGAKHPIYALAVSPAFFDRVGFEPVPKAELPPSLAGKVSWCDSQPKLWIPMRLRKIGPGPIRELPDPARDTPSFVDQ